MERKVLSNYTENLKRKRRKKSGRATEDLLVQARVNRRRKELPVARSPNGRTTEKEENSPREKEKEKLLLEGEKEQFFNV